MRWGDCRITTRAPDVAATLLWRVKAAMDRLGKRGLLAASGKPARWCLMMLLGATSLPVRESVCFGHVTYRCRDHSRLQSKVQQRRLS
jgi:hypothetical protein